MTLVWQSSVYSDGTPYALQAVWSAITATAELLLSVVSVLSVLHCTTCAKKILWWHAFVGCLLLCFVGLFITDLQLFVCDVKERYHVIYSRVSRSAYKSIPKKWVCVRSKITAQHKWKVIMRPSSSRLVQLMLICLNKMGSAYRIAKNYSYYSTHDWEFVFQIWWRLVHFPQSYNKKIDGPKFADPSLTAISP